MARRSAAQAAESTFHRIVSERALTTLFQPIVHLESGATVGYEALVRGPDGSAFASAEALLSAAYKTNRVVEFDWVARESACRAAIAAGLGTDHLLFLNIEPLALDSECPPDLWPTIKKAFDTYQVVLEVTERSLGADTGALLDGLDRQRPNVAGVALDDVGADPVTLSFLPIVAPAVVKLDRRVTQQGLTPAAIQILDIAYEEAGRTGATILAEGIETAEHRDLARSFGATLGQGYHFGLPEALGTSSASAIRPIHLRSDTMASVAAPFAALEGRPTARATAAVLRPLSHQLALGNDNLAPPALVLLLLPELEPLGDGARRMLTTFARRGVTTGLLGPGQPETVGQGVRGARRQWGEKDGREWAAIVLTATHAAALLARAIPGEGAEFEFGVTHDRQRVAAAARSLLRRLGPA